jgi:simple sugar transport system permease protein
MGVTPAVAPGEPVFIDNESERQIQQSAVAKLLARPELGAVAGLVLVWLFFAIYARSNHFTSVATAQGYTQVAAQFAIMAVPVSLLMIAGEFDLSIGGIVGATSLTTAVAYNNYLDSFWVCALLALALAVVIGVFNGLMVHYTRLPSFIVTLGTQFILFGLNVGLTLHFTGRTQIGGIDKATGFGTAKRFFYSDIDGWDSAIVWALLVAAIGTYVLLGTRFGNWIFGVGGNQEAARSLGVPIRRVKVLLYVATAVSAWIVGMLQLSSLGSTDTTRGTLYEFTVIICVVIGGTLLTGGYGSAFGALLGALIYGVLSVGIVAAQIDSSWYKAVLGAMLIIACLVNNSIRSRAAGVRR